MNVILSGIDHSAASVAERERFALSRPAQQELLARAAQTPGVLGAVLLSTCNRTELCLSLEEGAELRPFSLFEVEPEGAYTYAGREAFGHLAALAAGLKSRLFAEDQILTQVKNALVQARQAGTADAILEVFFREAVTAAKRVKTETRFSHGDVSAALAAKDVALSCPGVRQVLVIGNGEVGRAAASALAEAGLDVTMTLRQYRHGAVELPRGVKAVDYAERYGAMAGCQAVVSATASPHYTVTAAALAEVSPLPRLFLDLAMPRDLEPAIGELPGVTLLDVDQVADAASREADRGAALAQVQPMIEAAWADLTDWLTGREQAEAEPRHSHFPLFIDSAGKTVLVVGGGRIATRRALSLAKFRFTLTVVAPEVSAELERLAERGRVTLKRRPFEDGDLEDAFLVVAATDQRDVNHHVASLARHKGILASVADKKDECGFYFPGIVEDGQTVIGLCGDGGSHHAAAQTAKRIREMLKG